MFEDYTYERLLEDVLANAPEGIDTRQGSIFYDAVSGVLIRSQSSTPTSTSLWSFQG